MLKYPHLFSPIKVGNVVFRNRIFASPTGWVDIKDDCTLGDNAIDYYAEKAKGGAASVCVGECQVDRPRGSRGDRCIDLLNPWNLFYLGRIADKVKRHGAVASAELSHCGRYGGKHIGPSEGVVDGFPVTAYTAQDIEEIIENYVRSAVNVKMRGFNMVTIHGGHGWLPEQFFSEYTNKRTDEWGGSRENRARFAVTICDRIHEACGRDFPIEIRISASELSQGYGLDEGIEYAKALDGHADIIHVSLGIHGTLSNDEWQACAPTMFEEEGALVEYAAAIKKEMKHSLVGTVGSISRPEMMEEIIASGKADFINCARALLCDPYLPEKARAGRDEEIRPCIRCMSCWSSILTGMLVCAINPRTAREAEFPQDMEAKVKKNVVVIGGGIAGMEAALTARRCGHAVTLLEKHDYLGGGMHCEEKVPFKKYFRRYLEFQTREMEKAGVDVRLGTEATPEMMEEMRPDVILACVGSKPAVPPIPGIDGPNVVTAQYAFENPDKLGKKVAIIGGGLVGCELAIFLDMDGLAVDVIEMTGDINAPGLSSQGLAVKRELRRRGMKVTFRAAASRITKEGLYYTCDGEERFIEADTVIAATGQKPLAEEAFVFAPYAPQFQMIGDCSSVANIMTAVKNAYTIARDL
ncbi:MAG: FAD-dependent oxidoreductase [Lachnospiraceae bacterium]|nr:FAD-dependent oxidoreductase [Lachnospiraceae bacterium]